MGVVIRWEGLGLESVGQSWSGVWFPRQQLGSSGAALSLQFWLLLCFLLKSGNESQTEL